VRITPPRRALASMRTISRACLVDVESSNSRCAAAKPVMPPPMTAIRFMVSNQFTLCRKGAKAQRRRQDPQLVCCIPRPNSRCPDGTRIAKTRCASVPLRLCVKGLHSLRTRQQSIAHSSARAPRFPRNLRSRSGSSRSKISSRII
jgi:hypothetical protein